MSVEELQLLDAEEAKLQEKLLALQEKKKEIRLANAEVEALKKAEDLAKKEIKVVVTARSGGNLVCESLFRPDVLEIWKSVPGRAFKGEVRREYGAPDDGLERPAMNLIPIKAWDDCKEKLEALPLLTVSWDVGVEDDLNWFLTAPEWFVDIKSTKSNIVFEAKKGPNAATYGAGFSELPGAVWNWSDAWTIPLSEGWRIFTVLENTTGVVYSDAARGVILKQVEDRARLDEIVGQEDSKDPRIWKLDRIVWNAKKQIHEPFHDYLLPFQRVCVEFALVNGGKLIIADDTGLGKTCEMIAIAEILRMEEPKAQIVFSVKSGSIPNFKREILNLTGETPVLCVNTNGKKIEAIGKILAGAPYILISHDMMGTYVKEEGTAKDDPKNYNWPSIFIAAGVKFLGIDEAHQIRNLDTHRSKAHRKLGGIEYVIPATASPVINRTGEFWPLLNLIDPITFASHKAFEDTYTRDGKVPQNVAQLHEMLRPRFIRRRRGDVQEDMEDVNRVVNISSMSDEGMIRYEEVLAGFYRKLEIFDPSGDKPDATSVTHILAELLRLSMICSAEKVPFTVELAEQLNEETGKPGLIFAKYKGSAYRIAQELGHEAVCTVYKANGDFHTMVPEKRDEIFESARGDPNVKYVVTTEASKESHNIEYCYWVIFNDQLWSPKWHEQCEGRAHQRMRDPHPIDAYYLQCDVKIERWHQELLDEKFDIIEASVEGIELSRDVEGTFMMDLIKKIKEEMYLEGGQAA